MSSLSHKIDAIAKKTSHQSVKAGAMIEVVG